ncbi:hypothetical protein NADFUDRAFT_68027 [Nadsonia fulvescens var. elongata DSM 6958]|uniref:DNA repair protein Rad26 n=1 Tax=Nadsonia fulvescens var. elongata DSM 6958 TaxID=857566 RepID=A0A1E3PDY0_9ASCO|nr:hypothetical protein NADFUDRAFT_68027 [Nadsonia fulvescens var. elongata DSM 6958]
MNRGPSSPSLSRKSIIVDEDDFDFGFDEDLLTEDVFREVNFMTQQYNTEKEQQQEKDHNHQQKGEEEEEQQESYLPDKKDDEQLQIQDLQAQISLLRGENSIIRSNLASTTRDFDAKLQQILATQRAKHQHLLDENAALTQKLEHQDLENKFLINEVMDTKRLAGRSQQRKSTTNKNTTPTKSGQSPIRIASVTARVDRSPFTSPTKRKPRIDMEASFRDGFDLERGGVKTGQQPVARSLTAALSKSTNSTSTINTSSSELPTMPHRHLIPSRANVTRDGETQPQFNMLEEVDNDIDISELKQTKDLTVNMDMDQLNLGDSMDDDLPKHSPVQGPSTKIRTTPKSPTESKDGELPDWQRLKTVPIPDKQLLFCQLIVNHPMPTGLAKSNHQPTRLLDFLDHFEHNEPQSPIRSSIKSVTSPTTLGRLLQARVFELANRPRPTNSINEINWDSNNAATGSLVTTFADDIITVLDSKSLVPESQTIALLILLKSVINFDAAMVAPYILERAVIVLKGLIQKSELTILKGSGSGSRPSSSGGGGNGITPNSSTTSISALSSTTTSTTINTTSTFVSSRKPLVTKLTLNQYLPTSLRRPHHSTSGSTSSATAPTPRQVAYKLQATLVSLHAFSVLNTLAWAATLDQSLHGTLWSTLLDRDFILHSMVNPQLPLVILLLSLKVLRTSVTKQAFGYNFLQHVRREPALLTEARDRLPTMVGGSHARTKRNNQGATATITSNINGIPGIMDATLAPTNQEQLEIKDMDETALLARLASLLSSPLTASSEVTNLEYYDSKIAALLADTDAPLFDYSILHDWERIFALVNEFPQKSVVVYNPDDEEGADNDSGEDEKETTQIAFDSYYRSLENSFQLLSIRLTILDIWQDLLIRPDISSPSLSSHTTAQFTSTRSRLKTFEAVIQCLANELDKVYQVERPLLADLEHVDHSHYYAGVSYSQVIESRQRLIEQCVRVIHAVVTLYPTSKPSLLPQFSSSTIHLYMISLARICYCNNDSNDSSMPSGFVGLVKFSDVTIQQARDILEMGLTVDEGDNVYLAFNTS